MKYRDENGVFQDLYLPPTGDTLPIGSEVDYNGETVPYGWEEVTNPESYSTTEVKTNKTWIDGKPIYRKYVSIKNPSSISTPGSGSVATQNFPHGISNLDTCTNVINAMLDDNNMVARFPILSSNRAVTVIYNVTSTNIVMRTGDGWSTNWYLKCVLEYTKTTDTANSN